MQRNKRHYAQRTVRLLLTAALLLATLAAGMVFAPGAHAQVISPEPLPPVWPEPPVPPPPFPPFPPPPWPWPEPPAPLPATVELVSVDARVEGPTAQVTVKQLFRNDSASTLEAQYVFPLPRDAAPGSFQMTVDGQVVEGTLYDAEEARRIYEAIVRSLRDPALLEYLGRGLFQASVFPIPPGETRTVELTYEQVVGQEGGLRTLAVPLRAHVAGAAGAEAVSVRVELAGQAGLRTIYSPSHAVDVQRAGDDEAVISFEGGGRAQEQDFQLFWGTDEGAIGLNLLSYKPAGEDGFFLLLVAPGAGAAEQEVVERDIVVVLDVSGSMQGDKMRQAGEAVQYVVAQLNPGDRFNLITFSTGVRLWENELQEVSAAGVRDAQAWVGGVRATGATDINRALLEGLAQFEADGTRPAYLLFMTDGLPTQGETDVEQIIANARANKPEGRSVRLFTFGVGYDVNTDLLDVLSGEMGGRTTYVAPNAQIDEVVSAFYDQIGKPVLANVVLEMGAQTVVDDIYPYPLPDLFAGEQLVAAGRYRAGGAVDVELAGTVNGRPVAFVYPGQQLAERGGEPFVARLWATRKMGALLEQVRREGPNDELIDAIVELSLEYGIVSPYTSYLVLEPGMDGVDRSGVEGDAPVPLSAPGSALDSGAGMGGGDGAASLRRDAYAAAESVAAAVAAAPASGAAAVQASVERAALASAETVAQGEALRFVGGKTFARRGFVAGADGQPAELWVDTAYTEGMEVETVAFASERYWALLDEPKAAAWLSLSTEVIVVLEDGTALRVTAGG